MPPKAKFTKAEIIEAALNIVRADGYEALTSRALGMSVPFMKQLEENIFRFLVDTRARKRPIS